MHNIPLESGLSIAPCWDAAVSLSCLLCWFYMLMHKLGLQVINITRRWHQQIFFFLLFCSPSVYINNTLTPLPVLTPKACMQPNQKAEVLWVLINMNEVSVKRNSIVIILKSEYRAVPRRVSLGCSIRMACAFTPGEGQIYCISGRNTYTYTFF